MIHCYAVVPSYSATRELHVKLVLYGAASAGKASMLSFLYQGLRADLRGQLVSVQTGGDRTLFFDFYPPPPTRFLGATLRLQIYTTTGQSQNEATRRSMLAGSDGILFVADSRRGREQANILALEEMRNCLLDLNITLDQIPLVMAWNKRDLPDARSVGELEAGLNLRQVPSFSTVAHVGQGVFDAFRALAGRALDEAARRRPDTLHAAHRAAGVSTSDVVTSRRVLAMQDAQRAISQLPRRYMPELPAAVGVHVESALPPPQPLAAAEAAISDDAHVHPSVAAGVAATVAALDPIPPAPPPDSARPLAASVVSPRPELAPSPAKSTRAASTGRVESAPSSRLSQVPVSSPALAPTAPQADTTSSATASPLARDVWISQLIPHGSLRAQIQEIERLVLAGQWSAGVRRAAGVFYALTAAEATREPDEGPAWRGFALGLPVERYLRFRQAVQDAETGKCTVEDGLFSLFFLLDAALRKESWLSRGA